MATYYVDAATGNDADDGLSEADAWATIDKAMNTVAAGDKVWVKSGTSYTETATVDTVGTTTSPIVFEGYASSTGDGTLANAFVIDGESTRGQGINSTLATRIHYVFKFMRITGCTGSGLELNGESSIKCYQCRFDNNTNGIGAYVGNDCIFERCQVDNNSSAGIRGGSTTIVVGCRVFDSTFDGIFVGNGSIVVYNEVFGCGRDHILVAINGFVGNNIIDGENDADCTGIDVETSNPRAMCICNNIIHDCFKGIEASADWGEQVASFNNLYFSNGTDRTLWYEGTDNVEGVDPDFEGEASADYRLKDTSPAKAAGLDAGEIVNGVSYVDIGAHQRQEPAGGGGLLVHPGTSGGARG